LPRTSADIGWPEGQPWSLRGAAGLFRTVADGLVTAHEGCSRLAEVRSGTSWCGDGFNAFQETVDRNPTPADISNAQSAMFRAASACEVLADGIEDCQERIEWCRGRIDSLCIGAGGEIADEQRPIVEAIKADADAAHEDYQRHVERAEETFGTLEGETVYAQPPPGFWDQVGGTVSWGWGNIRENWNGIFDEGGFMYRFNQEVDNPLEYLWFSLKEVPQWYVGMWEGVVEMWDGMVALSAYAGPLTSPRTFEAYYNLGLAYQAFQDDPRQFLWDTGEAVLDYETLRESPTRWSGKLVPTIALGVLTGGAGVGASVAARGSALIARIARIAASLRRRPDTPPIPDELRNINPTGCTTNCGPVAANTDAWLGGRAAVPAPPTGPTPLIELEAVLLRTSGAQSMFVPVNGGRAGIEAILRQAGPGSKGIVAIQYNGFAHAFNAYNRGGRIVYYDLQGGTNLGPAAFNGAIKVDFMLTGYGVR
jgi:hypothetical protein